MESKRSFKINCLKINKFELYIDATVNVNVTFKL